MNLSTTVTLAPGRAHTVARIPAHAHPTATLEIRGGGVADSSGRVPASIENTSENRVVETDDWAGRADICKRADGTYVLVYRQAEHHGAVPDAELHVLFSADEGRTWGDPDRTLEGDPVEGLPYGVDGGSIGYGVLERTHDDDLLIFVARKPVASVSRHDLDGTGLLRSRDGGRTWTDEGKIAFHDHDGDDDGVYPSDSFVHPETGDVYLSSVYYPENDPDRTPQFALSRSRDGGHDWEFVGLISEDEWNNTGENGVEFLGGDRLLCAGRVQDDSGTVLYWSDDLGETWSDPVDIGDEVGAINKPRLYTEGAITDGMAYTAGALFMCGRERVVSRNAAQGEHNVVAVSTDGGETWRRARGKGYGDGGYSDITRRRDGTVYQVGYGGADNVAPCDLLDLTYDFTPELAVEVVDADGGEVLYSTHVPAERASPLATVDVAQRDTTVRVVNRSTREVDATTWLELDHV